jgi:oleate hydratase
MRGVRIFEEKAFTNTFDMMSKVPSLQKPNMNLREEFIAFNDKNKNFCKSRLLKRKKHIDLKSL